MKKIVTWIFAVLFTAPAMAADTVVASRAIPSSASTSTGAAAGVSVRDGNNSATQSRATVRRDTSVKNASATSDTNKTATRTSATTSRSVTASRGTSSRNATATGATARENLNAAVNTVGRNARVTAASVNSDPALRRAGISLRPSTAEVGGRAKIAGTDIQTGSNVGTSARAAQSRAAKTQKRETMAEAKERLEQTADLNKSCQTQYNECMDQFCSVVDSNQKRCSCSANLSRYTKVEQAVKDANTQLNDVAQRIRYVGLSADEIRAIMSATEAEEALSGTRDTTETRNMLEDIEEMIKNPSSSSSGVGTNDFSTLDLNLDFSDTSNMFNLDFLFNSNSSMSNLRGTELYNAAKKRCNTILTQCKEAGATQQQLTSNYDLAIDRDCIAYEQGLNKMNETLLSNVRSANLMLQKARLAVLQNKNQYDAKGCIAALDTCMKDEMVCGENYEKCLDPTKKYIDENGDVVVGQDITNIRKFMVSYDNSKIDSSFLRTAVMKSSVGDDVCQKNINGELTPATGSNQKANGDGWCAVKYLMQKIGTGVRSTDGLCRPVLDKCQRYTYNDKQYQPYNDVVVNYIQRAMVNIKAGQSKAIADYAANCMLDVATCYNQQVTQVNTWTSSASVSSIRNVMRGACRNVALTCGYALFDNCKYNAELSEFVAEVKTIPALYAADCPGDVDGIIEAVSTMFYNSMLCPANSVYTATKGTAGNDNYVNDHCVCSSGYEVFGTQCVTKCTGENEKRGSSGSCVCVDGYAMKEGSCTKVEQGGGNNAHNRPGNNYGDQETPGDTSGNGDEDVNQEILKNACTVLAQGQTSCPSGQSLVSGCCVSDFNTWNGYGSDGECKRASGCKKPDGTCTKSGSGACYPNPMCGPDNTCSVVLGSVSGTAADCDAQLPPASTLAQSKYSDYTYVGTISTTGQTTFYVPGQCVLKIMDKNGICYAIDTFQDHINSYGQINEKGIADYNIYAWGNVNVVDCDAKISHNVHGFDLNSNGGPKFVSGNGEKDSLRCDNGLTSIANVLNAMNIPDGYKFKGVYENANGSGTQYFNDKGQKKANPYDPQIVKQIYMIWEKPDTVDPEILKDACTVLAQGQTSCPSGQSLVSGCCVSDFSTWNGYGSDGECKRASGCQKPDGTCTQSGVCACADNPMCGPSCGCNPYTGSFKGTVDDCNTRLPPEKTLADKSLAGYTYVDTISTTGETTFYVPGQCVLKIKDPSGVCFALDAYDNHINSFRYGGIDENGIAVYHTYLSGIVPHVVNCDAKSYSGIHIFTIDANNGPSFVIKNRESSSLPIENNLTSIAAVLVSMNAPAECQFKGVYKNADGTGTQFFDASGNRVATLESGGGYMVWENCPQ